MEMFTFARTIGDLVRRPIQIQDPYDICQRWKIPADDPNVQHIRRLLAETWQRWTHEQRWQLLFAAESLAEAERAKQVWRRPSTRAEVLRISTSACNAARVAHELGKAYPPPWLEDPIADFMVRTKDLIHFALHKSHDATPTVAMMVASRAVKNVRKHTPKNSGRVSWELIGQLAWLAAGSLDGEPMSEAMVRKYAEMRKPKVRLGNISSLWNRAWPSLLAVSRMVNTHVQSVHSASQEQN